jgi:hypothetical protein
MAREYVPIFFEWLDVTQDLTAEEKGNLIDAVVSYASGREFEHLLCGAPCKIAFRFLKGQVDRNAAISDVRRQARQGKTQQPVLDVIKQEQTTTNDNKTEQTASNSPKEKEKEKEKENKKDVMEPQKRFTPPTVEDVRAYCTERGNNIDPEYFIDYQTARDWVLSNGKRAKDWRAVIRTWEKNGYNSRKPEAKKTVAAQQYAQRDYAGEQEKAFERMVADIQRMQA